MFTIYLKGVKVFAYHGVNPEENRDGQYFYLDVTAKTVTQAKELETPSAMRPSISCC